MCAHILRVYAVQLCERRVACIYIRIYEYKDMLMVCDVHLYTRITRYTDLHICLLWLSSVQCASYVAGHALVYMVRCIRARDSIYMYTQLGWLVYCHYGMLPTVQEHLCVCNNIWCATVPATDIISLICPMCTHIRHMYVLYVYS